MTLTLRLVALAALGAVLAWVSAAAVLGWAGALVVLVIVDIALAARIGDLRLGRRPSASVRLGQTGSTELVLVNAGRRRLRGEVRDAWEPSAGIAPRVRPVLAAPGGRRLLESELRPTRRGARRAVVVTVRSYGPLGLAARQRRVAVPGSLRVLPPFTSRRFLPEKLARLRQLDGAVLVRRRGPGSEFDTLRSYVLGDDVRAIDWRATARSRDVVVRTWRPERDRQVVLAIDTGRSSAARLGDAPRLDAALDACLLLTAVAARAGDRVALVAADVAVRARLGSTGGADALAAVADAVTPLQPALVETDPQLLASQVLRQVSKRALVVVFGSLDTAAESGLLPAVAALVARHRVVVAAVADPTLENMIAAREDAADVADVYAAAAAELAVAARSEVAARVRRLGATVVTAAADVFASAVADAYLDLKAAGQL